VPRRTALPPRDVTPPRRRAHAGAWALRSGRLARWATSLPRARAVPGKTMGHVHCASGPCNSVQTGRVGTVAVGCALLCHGGFGPVAFDLFFYLLNIFKSLQIKKFVYDSFELRKL
jgi:hypothetical protein